MQQRPLYSEKSMEFYAASLKTDVVTPAHLHIQDSGGDHPSRDQTRPLLLFL